MEQNPELQPDLDAELQELVETEEASGALVRVRLPEKNQNVQSLQQSDNAEGEPLVPSQKDTPLRWSNW